MALRIPIMHVCGVTQRGLRPLHVIRRSFEFLFLFFYPRGDVRKEGSTLSLISN